MSEKQSITVRIRGQELRIRSAEDPAALERIARTVEETMQRVEARTGSVDSLDVTMLTALNLAREVVEARDRAAVTGAGGDRLRALIELAESAITPEAR